MISGLDSAGVIFIVTKILTWWIRWLLFRSLFDKATYRSGRQAQDERGLIRVILFKMLVLQQLFVMTGEEIEFQFNGRRLLLPLLSTVLISFSRSVASLVAIYVHRASAKVQLSVVF